MATSGIVSNYAVQRDAFFRIVPVYLRGRIPLSPFFNDMIDREIAVQEWRQTLR